MNMSNERTQANSSVLSVTAQVPKASQHHNHHQLMGKIDTASIEDGHSISRFVKAGRDRAEHNFNADLMTAHAINNNNSD